MKVRLLKDVLENGQPKITMRLRQGVCFAWTQGRELEVSEATGMKLIERGDAEPVAESA